MQPNKIKAPPGIETAATAGTGSGRSFDCVTGSDTQTYRNSDPLATALWLAELAARAEFLRRAGFEHQREWLSFIRMHGLDLHRIGDFIGATGVLPITEFQGNRFDFARPGEGSPAFIIEARGEDETRFLDFVAQPLSAPERPLTMFGRVGLLGIWNASNASTYALGGFLVVHKTPLDWLRAGCQGSAIVDPKIAARQLYDLPGNVCGQDQRHSRQLLAMADGILDRKKFLTPVDSRWRVAS